jgi:predicted nicotinamide N-methyase
VAAPPPSFSSFSSSSSPVVLMSYEHRTHQDFDPRERFTALATAAGLVKRIIPRSQHDDMYQAEDIELWEVKVRRQTGGQPQQRQQHQPANATVVGEGESSGSTSGSSTGTVSSGWTEDGEDDVGTEVVLLGPGGGGGGGEEEEGMIRVRAGGTRYSLQRQQYMAAAAAATAASSPSSGRGGGGGGGAGEVWGELWASSVALVNHLNERFAAPPAAATAAVHSAAATATAVHSAATATAAVGDQGPSGASGGRGGGSGGGESKSSLRGAVVLELGSGCLGFVALAAARLGASVVVASDKAAALPLLRANLRANCYQARASFAELMSDANEEGEEASEESNNNYSGSPPTMLSAVAFDWSQAPSEELLGALLGRRKIDSSASFFSSSSSSSASFPSSSASCSSLPSSLLPTPPAPPPSSAPPTVAAAAAAPAAVVVDFILCADCVYALPSVAPLLASLKALARKGVTKVVIANEQRTALDAFLAALRGNGFDVTPHGIVEAEGGGGKRPVGLYTAILQS